MKELGRRVRSKRVKMGLSQTALGRRVGRTHGWVSSIEHGTTQEPPAELITALARELGEDPAEFLRLAGRVSLTAERIIPAVDDRPAWAIELFRELAAVRQLAEETRAAVRALEQGLPRGIEEGMQAFVNWERSEGFLAERADPPSGSQPAPKRTPSRRPVPVPAGRREA